ncbi:hypothetical protein D3C87_2169050 [compost metagenome]
MDAGQVVLPAVRGVAEDIAEEVLPVGALELGFDLAGQVDDLAGGPLRQHAGVDDQEVIFQDRQGLIAQPGE